MISKQCNQCGANYTNNDDCCTERFNSLLALDHSHREPWGSRHGQAFAAFALQHPTRYPSSLDVSWLALYRIHINGQNPKHVFDSIRAYDGQVPIDSDVPVRPARQIKMPTVTIADLGHFEAESYPALLDEWCLSTLQAWGARFPNPPD